MSFRPSLSSIAACSAEQQSYACFRFKNTSKRSASQIVVHKRGCWEVSSSTQRNVSFKTTTDNRNKTRWTSTFTYFNHHESWAAVLYNLCYRDFVTLRWRLARRRSGCVTTTTLTITTLVLTLSIDNLQVVSVIIVCNLSNLCSIISKLVSLAFVMSTPAVGSVRGKQKWWQTSYLWPTSVGVHKIWCKSWCQSDKLRAVRSVVSNPQNCTSAYIHFHHFTSK